MKPKLSEHAARLAQVKRGIDQVADGFFNPLPLADDAELDDLFASFNRMIQQVSTRESSLREYNVQLAASVSRIEKLLDASLDGVALIGQDGTFNFVNRRFCEILGLHGGSLNHKTMEQAQLLWNDSIANPLRLHRVLAPPPHDNQDGATDVVDDVVELSGGEPRYAQVYGAPVYDDDGVFAGRIVSLHDNTREMELDRLKTEFISVVSHELRTPLTSIKGYTDLLLSGATGEINEIQQEFLGILQASANRLGNLINDILDLSRIDAGRMEVKHEPLDYAKIVGDLVMLMKAAADEKELSLDVSFPQVLPVVLGDPDKISQVVSNLLSNAIKYTPEGGWIKIMVEVPGDSTVRTCIADSGIGISSEDQKRLFQKFFRADNSLTRQAGGTGLGLVIVKSIIELLGGTIWVQSEPGRGTKFFYTLPLALERKLSAVEQSLDKEQSTIPDRGRALVLVVDDSSFIRETIQHSLHRRGYGVLNASSPEEALQKARSHKPDIVLMDIMMEEGQGFQALNLLRLDPATDALSIVAFSMQGDSSSDHIAMGAVSFLNRPPDLSPLIASLKARESALAQRSSVLMVTFSPEQLNEASIVVNELSAADLDAKIVLGVSDAITTIVAKSPDAIIIDTEDVDDGELYSLLTALKSEQDIARIPIILTTNRFIGDGIHFHLGDSSPDMRTAVDYIGEQVSAVLRINSSGSVSASNDEEAPESGILKDN